MTGIRVRTDDFGVRRVAAVETEHGSIQTPCVVNCAGGTGARRPLPCPAVLRGGAPGVTDLGESPSPRPAGGPQQLPAQLTCGSRPAGVWAGAVGRMAGVKVPLVAMHHAYVVTERIEGIQVRGQPRASCQLWEAGLGGARTPALTGAATPLGSSAGRAPATSRVQGHHVAAPSGPLGPPGFSPRSVPWAFLGTLRSVCSQEH